MNNPADTRNAIVERLRKRLPHAPEKLRIRPVATHGRPAEKPAPFLQELRDALGPGSVKSDLLERHVRAHDASHYLLLPQAIAIPEGTDDVAAALRIASSHRIPVTFRSGGTSLCGQASGAGLHIDTRHASTEITVLDGGERVTVGPGATIRAVNTRLGRYGRTLGPDPASSVACTIGGVVANNSSGMAAGTEHNSYRTLESLEIVLASGTRIDTSAPDADSRLAEAEPALYAKLVELRDRLRSDPEAVAEVRERFSMKNTMGYAVNAFLDFENPIDILMHLMVGSEGTLGYVARATYRTIPVLGKVATTLLVFDDVDAAATALPSLVASGAATVELMDSTSLRVAQNTGDAPDSITSLNIRDNAALLVEYRAADAARLASAMAAARPVLESLALSVPFQLTSEPAERAALWTVRNGLYTSVAADRPAGTTALLEDIVVPVAELAPACRELAGLIDTHGYEDGVIFGHAKDGNFHFMITDDFSKPKAIERLDAFTRDMVDLVLRHGGNLKAEHGTGRAMAPFMSRQYSPFLMELMREVKAAFDPAGILNPGVLLPESDDAHIENIKPAVAVDPLVDRCVSCGYCEPVCPSRGLTLTPRQRIAANRARAHAEATGDAETLAAFENLWRYDVVDTCAACGMCETNCPVHINTGMLVKELRSQGADPVARGVWKAAAKRWDVALRGASAALDATQRIPEPLVHAPNAAARALLGTDRIPLHTEDLPGGGIVRSRLQGAIRAGSDEAAEADAIFFPACQASMFAAAGAGTPGAFLALCRAAGVRVAMPPKVDALCCTTPWSSKGFKEGRAHMGELLLERFAETGASPQAPVVVDAASCTHGVEDVMEAAREVGDPRAREVVDAVAFVAREVLPRLPELEDLGKIPSLALHPTCSSTQLGINADLRALAEAIAVEVHVPLDWGCCAFAGDRGMLHPELTASATRAEAVEVAQVGAAAHASCNRACEIGMSRATGETYEHILERVAEAYGLV